MPFLTFNQPTVSKYGRKLKYQVLIPVWEDHLFSSTTRLLKETALILLCRLYNINTLYNVYKNKHEVTLVNSAVPLGHFVHEFFRVAVVLRQTGLQQCLYHLSVVRFHGNGQRRTPVVQRFVQFSAELQTRTASQYYYTMTTQQVVKEISQKAASHVVPLLTTELSLSRCTPQQRLPMLFRGQTTPKIASSCEASRPPILGPTRVSP